MNVKLAASLLCVGLTQTGVATADIEDNVRFSGFGTIGITYSDEDQADYRSNIEQSTGAGASHKFDTGTDSIFGAQMDVQLTSEITATTQVINRRLSDFESAKPYFEWANIKYEPNEQTYIRAGRFVAPTFMISESRMVGYAQPAVRPVAEVYLLSPISYMNGVDGGYKFALGETFVKLRAGIATLNQQITQVNGTLDFKFDIKSVDASIENGSSTFRLGYQRINMDVDNDALDLYDQAMAQLVANNATNAASIQGRMQRLDVPLDFINVGYMYDDGSFLVQSEYAIRKFDSDFVQSLDGFYLLGGYRFGTLTPYASVSSLIHRDKAKLPELDTSSIDPGLGGLVTAVNAGSQYLISRDAFSIGVRWDLMENMALKAQIDHIVKPANSQAEFVNQTAEFFAEKRNINVFGTTLDFMF